MHRFLFSPQNKCGEEITLSNDEFKHLSVVLRLKVGEEIECSCGDGQKYICKITRMENDRAIATVISSFSSIKETTTSLTLFQGVPKGDKLEFIVQKMCELGVKRLVPFDSSFCIAKLKNEKVERLQKISDQATKQCGRDVPLKVEQSISFNSLCSRIKDFDVVLFANESESVFHIKGALPLDSKNIAVIVGSEGGFSKEERKKLVDNGAKSISLGKRILRTETAAIAIVSVAMFLLGEWE